MSEQFSTLTPLPGGNHRYLDTLSDALLWVQDTLQPTRDRFARWFMRRYEAGERSVANYIQGIARLDVIAIDGLDRVALTPFGHTFLASDHDTQTRLVLDYLLIHCIGLAEVLAIYATSTEPLHIQQVRDDLQGEFPNWTHVTPFQHRAQWLLSLGCLEQVKGRYYQITALGRSLVARLPASATMNGTSNPVNKIEALIAELEAAAVDSAAPQRLQHAVFEVFSYLGFTVEERGASGDTDLIIQANIGADSYSAIVDVKSRSRGRLQDLSAYTLEQHRQHHEANYTLVIAGNFAEGKLTRQAEEYDIVLLPIALLGMWLRQHEATPLNLLIYRSIFTQPGKVVELPAQILAATRQRIAMLELVHTVVTTLEALYKRGYRQALTPEQLFGLVMAQSQTCTMEQIEQVLAYLSHPLVEAMIWKPDHTVILALGWNAIAHPSCLRSLL